VGTDGDADYLHEALAAAERRHFWFVSRAALIGWAMRRYFPRAQSILEVGCGTGGVTGAIRHAFPDARIVAGDADPGGLEYARRSVARVSFVELDVCRLPFDAEFDVAGAFDVIEHLDDDGRALAAMRVAVKPGGGVVITVPQHPWLWSAVDEFSHHRRRYTRAELRANIENAGLRIVRMTSFTSLLLPMMLLSRLKPGRFDPERELKVPAVVNAVFLALLAVERCAIALGVSLPAGGSLLAIAERPFDFAQGRPA
jgi:SAM-dependent methyltransferase